MLRGHDSIWVIVDRLTKSGHFLPVKITYKVIHLAIIFIREMVRMHGVPINIILDRDLKFISRFWKDFYHAMGTHLNLSTLNYLKFDG